MDTLLRDLRHAVRSLLARPTYSIVTIVTIALVIGAASAVLAVVNATMIRPLPFPHADRLVQLFEMPPDLNEESNRNPLHPRAFYRFRHHLKLADAVEGVWARERALGGDGDPETVTTGMTSAGIFDLFGGVPLMGRVFTEQEDQANARVAVLGYDLWQRRFGGQQDVLGRTILIDREPYEVIGVMPRSFAIAYVVTEMWMPLNITEAGLNNSASYVQSFARLRDAATPAQLSTELEGMMKSVDAEAPAALAGWHSYAREIREAQFGAQRSGLLALLGGVLALALIACANLANLSLAEVISRRPEFALRTALGGGRGSIIRLQLLETLLLSAAGAIAGIFVGQWTLPALLALDPTTAKSLEGTTIDWRVQLAAAVVAAVVGIIAAMAPLLSELGGDIARSMAAGSRRTAGSRASERARRILVGAQCAATVVLMACGALLLSAFQQIAHQDPGFDPTGVLGAQMRISAAAYPTTEARGELIARVLERIRGVPGVTSASATLNPFNGVYFVTNARIEGKPAPDGQAYTVGFRRSGTEYFKTLKIPLLKGRDFSDADGASAPAVAIISRSFADKYWPGEDPIGRHVLRGNPPAPVTVVGVVDDVRDTSLTQAIGPMLYMPFSQNNVAITPVSLVVRAAGDPLALSKAVRAAVLSVDPAQPIDHIVALSSFLSDSVGKERFRSVLLLLLGALGLVLAGVGIYGVTARSVEERTRELGVRLALGATRGMVVRLVVQRSLAAVLAGLAVGSALAVGAAVALGKVLPELAQAQAWQATPTLAILIVVAGLAALIPAARTVSIDPSLALRGE